MGDEGSTNQMLMGIIVALVIGLAGGYYYGVIKGKAMEVAEQKEAAAKATEDAQKQLAEQANPFRGKTDAVNPFTEGYQNPFKGFNPFAQ